MATQGKFWQRVGQMFRGGRGNGGQSPDAGDDGGDGLAVVGTRAPTRRDLKDRYERVVELMDAMESHFRRQDERAEALTKSVDRVAGILERIAAAHQQQNESIGTIADRVGTVATHAARLSETLGQVPSSMNAQAEAVRVLSRQIEVAQEADHQTAASLSELGRAVNMLEESTRSQVTTLKGLHDEEASQKETLTNLVHQQSRRFLVLLIVVAVIGVGAVVMMGLTLYQLLSR